MAVLGGIIIILLIVFLVWFLLFPKFNRVGKSIINYIEESKNKDNENKN